MKRIRGFVVSISFIIYVLALTVLLFMGARGYVWADLTTLEYIKLYSNFVPFQTISTYVEAIFTGSMNLDIPIKNLAGNFIMFLPMGFYLPYFIRKLNKITIFSIAMILLLFSIEVIQLATKRGSFDIDDFILNMSGALLGFVIWKWKAVQQLLK
ncbi:VanZ family protein [Jeotgalibacillus proteolyticus]|uniref:VanZ family protein n=1 Tax=Jeotgalibacillus proteolyticus TaxID=2082395 RepID=A0A2S5GCX0_9BACL|nr:VanZ family protein [Jeotgalibacillus proteolyticus]PPA70754.1 VanZ family protein [Jeotgalibacillus proteolyticus]